MPEHGLRCRGWRQEAILRLLENNLAIAEDPENLVVYAAHAKAARDHESLDAIVAALQRLARRQTLVVQSGKPIAVLPTGPRSPAVLLANGNLVGRWATPEMFYDLERRNLHRVGRPDRRLLAVHRLPGRAPGDLRDVRAGRARALRRHACGAGWWSAAVSAAWAPRSRWRSPGCSVASA